MTGSRRQSSTSAPSPVPASAPYSAEHGLLSPKQDCAPHSRTRFCGTRQANSVGQNVHSEAQFSPQNGPPEIVVRVGLIGSAGLPVVCPAIPSEDSEMIEGECSQPHIRTRLQRRRPHNSRSAEADSPSHLLCKDSEPSSSVPHPQREHVE